MPLVTRSTNHTEAHSCSPSPRTAKPHSQPHRTHCLAPLLFHRLLVALVRSTQETKVKPLPEQPTPQTPSRASWLRSAACSDQCHLHQISWLLFFFLFIYFLYFCRFLFLYFCSWCPPAMFFCRYFRAKGVSFPSPPLQLGFCLLSHFEF